MKKLIVSFITICILFIHSQAQVSDSIMAKIPKGIENKTFNAYLDSLETLSYIKPLLKDIDRNFEKKTLTDQQIKKKLNSLPLVIKTEYNHKVREFIDFYTTENRTQVEIALGLAYYYLPECEVLIRDYNLPGELKYLPVVESALYPHAVSSNGATGIWQLMYPIAKRYGLQLTSYTDERRDYQKSTRAAILYLKDMYEIFYDWSLVIAAYNCGPANVNKAIARANGNRNFWAIYEHLPQATREYVPAFIAMIYVMNFYEDYDINPLEIDFPGDIDTLKLDKKLHLMQISEVLKIPYNELRDLNPEYRLGVIHAENDNNELKLYAKDIVAFNKEKDSIYAHEDSVYFKPKKPTVVAHTTSTQKASSNYKKPSSSYSTYKPATPKGKTQLIYVVKSGDSLGLIAQWYGVNVSDIKHWNGMYSNKLMVNRKLKIYVEPSLSAKYRKINSMTYTQKQAMCGKTSSGSSPSSSASQPQKLSDDYVYYKIKSGDNLWVIAQKYPGISHYDLMKINNFSKNYKLHPGQMIKIKKK